MDRVSKQDDSKCKTCQFYDKQRNICILSDKEKYNNTDFLKCSSYLISDKLVNY